jgi:hypothetical protein
MNENLRNLFLGYGVNGKEELSDDHCGAGSTTWYTEIIRASLPGFLKKHNIKSMLDAPCGHFEWMSKIQFPENFDYLGADIHPDLVERNNKKFGNKFTVLDITEDDLPSKELLFVRDCLFHFDDALKLKFFRNFLRNDFKYILTSHHPRHPQNINLWRIEDFTPVNWFIDPWNFPLPIDFIVDYNEIDPRFHPHPYRIMSLWSREQIQSVIPL